VLSGFCGLIYESIWSQYLKLFLGHAAYAQTVVLIVFIGGLALGAWPCQPVRPAPQAPAHRPTRPRNSSRDLGARLFHSCSWRHGLGLCNPAPATLRAQIVVLDAVGVRAVADPAAVDPTRHDVPADDERRAAPGSRDAGLQAVDALFSSKQHRRRGGVLASGFLLIPMIGLPARS